jgi:hypothetical protein
MYSKKHNEIIMSLVRNAEGSIGVTLKYLKGFHVPDTHADLSYINDKLNFLMRKLEGYAKIAA